MKCPWWNPRISLNGLCVLAFVVHTVLFYALTGTDIVSLLLASGSRSSWLLLMCATTFALARLFLLLAVPGVLAWRIASWLAGRIMRN